MLCIQFRAHSRVIYLPLPCLGPTDVIAGEVSTPNTFLDVVIVGKPIL